MTSRLSAWIADAIENRSSLNTCPSPLDTHCCRKKDSLRVSANCRVSVGTSFHLSPCTILLISWCRLRLRWTCFEPLRARLQASPASRRIVLCLIGVSVRPLNAWGEKSVANGCSKTRAYRSGHCSRTSKTARESMTSLERFPGVTREQVELVLRQRGDGLDGTRQKW